VVALTFRSVESQSEYLDALEDNGLDGGFDRMMMEIDGEFITKELEGVEIDVEPAEAIGVEEIFTWEEPQDLTINDEPEEVA